MVDKTLLFAQNYEKVASSEIPKEWRPVFHLTPRVGWMNDPNGFSYYKGRYHLFYQNNPYDTIWDSMHWGHAVSEDLLRWEYLPCALAPDKPYDSYGCFSGSAVELSDGRQLIMYTGVQKESGDFGKDIQTQCIAAGDGVEYQKYSHNPVIDVASIPEGLSPNDFRDPKLWQEPDGSFRCVIGARKPQKEGQILLFSSPDGFSWKFESVLIENDGRFGMMWECPDFFELDGNHVLLCSPQDMLPEDFEYHNGNGTLCLIGTLDEEKKHFTYGHDQTIDYGIDFYAPQTLLSPDGRRIMIGWMQNWGTCDQTKGQPQKWNGQMTLPRELHIKNERLYQYPVKELEQYRSNPVIYKNVAVSGELALEGIEGRKIDMELTIRPKDKADIYNKFVVLFAQDDRFYTKVSYHPHESVLKLDRKYSGSRRAVIHQRRCRVPYRDGEIRMRMIMDKYSVELFINDGEQVMTAVIMTEFSAKGISFAAEGSVELDVTKYDLFAEE